MKTKLAVCRFSCFRRYAKNGVSYKTRACRINGAECSFHTEPHKCPLHARAMNFKEVA